MIIVPVTMRIRTLAIFAVLALSALLPARGSDHTPPPTTGDASTYPANDSHPDEHVVIAADPCNTREKCKFFRVDYLKFGFMPIRLIVTNNGEKPISLSDARIHFISAAGDKVQAAEPEDISRRSNQPGNVKKTIPLPAPLPPIHRKPGSHDKEIDEDFTEQEYSAIAVEPHTTRAGYLFYDVEELGNEPLRGAKLYLRMLRGADGKELFYFEIPFDKYLAAPQ
jgi:hypothetical protein